jgi:hypothetical protein
VGREYGGEDARLAGSVDQIALTRAIGELPAGYRTIFLLHEVEGYEHQEIAEIRNCFVGDSKSQLHKAKLRIRESLGRARDQVLEEANKVAALSAGKIGLGLRLLTARRNMSQFRVGNVVGTEGLAPTHLPLSLRHNRRVK